MWQMEIRHDGLHKYRVIKGATEDIVEQKAAAQLEAWDEMWEKKQEREARIQEKEDKKQTAMSRTEEAQVILRDLEKTLLSGIDKDYSDIWDMLLDKSSFPELSPRKTTAIPIPLEPRAFDEKYKPKSGILEFIFKDFEEKRKKEAGDLFKNDRTAWEKEKKDIIEKNKQAEDNHKKLMEQWQEREKAYLEKRDKKNGKILKMKEAYFEQESEAIKYLCEIVLSKSDYPDNFPQEYEVDYNADTKTLIVDYLLPSKDSVPTLKEVKYIVSQDKMKEKHLSESALNKMYDDLLYQITLRTIYEIYASDTVPAISSIVFNGIVEFVDKGTGQNVTSCILSIQTVRDEFMSINLQVVDPKTCFKQLKGVGSSKLHGLAPVAPIICINKEDKRFVESYEVVNNMDESTNIAAMDWQDFENLIREIFEKEFSGVGGEVKITQASRDRGVDAIAFDPDPIRGGKIVIQAKRYTNIVGVSAVRDLYGTVMNEGATKGILVTTTDYGPDAYHFAKDKPLTLLNGSNLLHLLEKHGHKAKIDINEAKKIAGEN